MTRKIIASAVLAGTAAVLAAQDAVPPRYRALYRELDERLTRFEEGLPRRASGGSVTFAAELLYANGNRGEALLAPLAFRGAVLYLQRLQELGVGGVTIQMPYPLLDAAFPRSAEYWGFYGKLAAEIRKRGLKLLVKTGPVFTQSEISPVRPNYSKITWDEYLSARTRIAERISRELEPDYLTIVNEPSTEAAVLGKTPIGEARYVQFINDTLGRVSRTRTLVGAGTGTWDRPSFVAAFASQTGLDYIDLHMYPLASRGADYVTRAMEMAATARARGKRLIIGEFWLYKSAAQELGTSPIQVEIFARDAFGFWSPLDARLLRAVRRFAETNGIEYVSAFWSRHFFASLDQSKHASLSPGELLRASEREAARALLAGEVSPTGAAFRDVIAGR
jgi:hypothetical protein